MTKNSGRDKNIDFWQNLEKLLLYTKMHCKLAYMFNLTLLKGSHFQMQKTDKILDS